MGGIKKAGQNQANSAAISIAISFSQGLNNGPGGLPLAQAFAGPEGAFAQAGQGGPGGLGSLCGCGHNHNMGAFQNNFGGPQNPAQAGFQAGFQQGQMAAKMQRLMRKLHRLMAQMGGGGFGGPQAFGPQSFGAPFGGSQAFASSGMPFRGLV